MERRQALHPRQKGAAAGPLSSALETACALLHEGKYFEAHDALEPAWMAASGDLKLALQGLIQIAAGLHKRAQGQEKGASYLIGRGMEKVHRCGSALPPGLADTFLEALTKH